MKFKTQQFRFLFYDRVHFLRFQFCECPVHSLDIIPAPQLKQRYEQSASLHLIFPLPGFQSTVPIWSVFVSNLFKDEGDQFLSRNVLMNFDHSIAIFLMHHFVVSSGPDPGGCPGCPPFWLGCPFSLMFLFIHKRARGMLPVKPRPGQGDVSSLYIVGASKQGRRSLWDRGTRPPNIWTGGTLSRMSPQYF